MLIVIMVDVRLHVSREMPMPSGAVYHDRFDVSRAIGVQFLTHASVAELWECYVLRCDFFR